MSEDEYRNIEVSELYVLIEKLNAHANVAKISGYFEAAFDIIAATKKLNNLASALIEHNLEVSQ